MITVNEYGHGKAYYIAANPEKDLIDELMSALCEDASIKGVLGETYVQEGIGIVSREDEEKKLFSLETFPKKSKLYR